MVVDAEATTVECYIQKKKKRATKIYQKIGARIPRPQ